MSYTLINDDTPWPLLRADPAHTPTESDPMVAVIRRTMYAGGDFPLFRGVPIDRYPTIAASGVDVSPTNTTIFCAANLEKALGYTRTPTGGRVGAILVFRGSKLQKSWRTLEASADSATAEGTLREYPHRTDCGDTLWFSRLPNSTAYSGYETEYGYWIPGDAHAALAAVILVGDVHIPYDWSPPGEPSQKWVPPQHWLKLPQ